MRNGFRFFLTAVIGAAACTLVARAADDPPKEKHYKSYTFETTDGVKLDGDLYSNAASPTKKDATVLLLHDLDLSKGSSRADPGWDKLAERLQKEGYSVFAFDFRGFGKSTEVTDKFWDHAKNPQNQMVKGWNKTPPPESISYKGFEHAYYPQLANDVAAAKAWLDKNAECNTSSFFVIGAGEGAAIGSLWMDSEWHRQKGNVNPVTGAVVLDPKTLRPMLEDPEGIDEAGAVWLSISPTLAGQPRSTSVHSWIGETGGARKVPVGLYYGDGDETGSKNSASCLAAIHTGYRSVNPGATDAAIKEKLEHTLSFAIKETKLSGNKLLLDDLPTSEAIVKFLNPVMEKRRNVAPRTRDVDKSAYFWTFPGSTLPVQAKLPTDPNLPLIPVAKFMK
jgi:alpha-beta hydrolase superfamily lysophospholipase